MTAITSPSRKGAPAIGADDIRLGIRFVRRLPQFLRMPLTGDQARATIQRRLADRAKDFLSLAREFVYPNQQSPYRKLLDCAGCEYGDLVHLVQSEGLEESLQALFRQGVFLSVDEFKGHRPIVRGSVTIEVDQDQLRNPRSEFHFPARTGGSSGTARPIFMDLSYIRDRAADTLMTVEARGGRGWVHAIWGVPGGSAMIRILESAAMGIPMQRWFSQVDAGAPGLHPRYLWSARAMRVGGMIAGVRLPLPEHTPPGNPEVILRWIRDTLAEGRTPHLHTFSSAAVRLCQFADESGIDLHGVHFQTASELLTNARRKVIESSGATAYPAYASMETGPIGCGCLQREQADDLHVITDLHAVIQPGGDGDCHGLPAEALLVTSLRPTATMILLNVSMGDHARMVRRACGCILQDLGWGTHIHTVRSFEKLTAGGMTFLDFDVVRVLEELLPGRFGGTAGDYQLVEEETEKGQPRLLLLVDPRLGQVDTAGIAHEFLRAVRTGSPAQEVMGRLWQEADLLRVVRSAPVATAAGKVLPIRRELGSHL
jgi:hypothetical protein